MSTGTGRRRDGVHQSRARIYAEKEMGVTFTDVAGEDEAKEGCRRSSCS
jgi:ATP-dependent Zn protease